LDINHYFVFTYMLTHKLPGISIISFPLYTNARSTDLDAILTGRIY